MSWVKIDDGAPEHRKLLEVGAAAAWLWVCGLAYCNRQKARDGFIPDAKVATLYPMTSPRREAARLVCAGLWESVPGGFVVHDYHDFQPTTDDMTERRRKRSEAGRMGGLASGESRKQTKQTRSKHEAPAKQTVEANANPEPDPDPVNTKSSLTSQPRESDHSVNTRRRAGRGRGGEPATVGSCLRLAAVETGDPTRGASEARDFFVEGGGGET